MNVLILTAKCGMGHYSASEAIKETLLADNEEINVKIVDFFEYLFPQFSHIIYGSFNFMVQKCSSIYNTLYQLTSRENRTPLVDFISNKIKKLIESNNVDLVISTFPVCSRYVSLYKEFNKYIPLYTFITDVSANTEWISKNTDLYCVASPKTKLDLVRNGVPSGNILITGIPVKNVFKHLVTNYKINSKREILVMGGGLGILPSVDYTITELSHKENIHITIIAGKNKNLIQKYKDKENITIVGYTNKVYEYMENSDLIITKAGGITLFEAIYARTPLYIITPFLNQELGNAKFIEENRIGRVSWNKKYKITEDIYSLVNNKRLLNSMKHNMTELRLGLDNLYIAEFNSKSNGN